MKLRDSPFSRSSLIYFYSSKGCDTQLGNTPEHSVELRLLEILARSVGAGRTFEYGAECSGNIRNKIREHVQPNVEDRSREVWDSLNSTEGWFY